MDVADSFSSYPHQDSSFLPKASYSKHSGLTLVLPGLKGGKVVVKGGKKSKNGPYAAQEEERKIARPVKLKPLKEVLKKLIVQIQKKDDYAFFLKPVDVSQVPGYSAVVKRPMDLGTMSVKVTRGKYRSLEDFASDLRLVTSNAKAFNPPGTIYHTEAERIETWALDHIQRASATVIQYETDWNIDVERDDDAATVNVEDDDDLNINVGTPMDVDEPGPGGRSPSVASQVPSVPGRRTTRTLTKKVDKAEKTNPVSESVDAEGRLPGSRDGIGAFPPGSDWARTMLALKIKGKRYKTKKERLQREKEGPPLLADGSLDYTEMEDPFSILSVFAPEPLSRPYLAPLYPPLFPHHPTANSIPDPPFTQSQSQPDSQPHTPRPRGLTPAPTTTSTPTVYPSSTTLPLDHTLSSIPVPHLLAPGYTLNSATTASSSSTTTTSYFASTSTAQLSAVARRRHWAIMRNPPRAKLKEKEGDQDAEGSEGPSWQTPREAHTFDFGSYAVLAGALESELRRRGSGPSSASGSAPWKDHTTSLNGNGSVNGKDGDDEEQKVLEVLRESVECPEGEETVGLEATGDVEGQSSGVKVEEYWTDERAVAAEGYLRDVVYGGVEGLAYVRSLAEFVHPGEMERRPCPELGGLTLAKWVEREVVDTLTQGRHFLLREAAFELTRPPAGEVDLDPLRQDPPELESSGDVRTQVWRSLHVYPRAALTLAALRRLATHKIDMAALIRTPEELFESEKVWVGKVFRERRRCARVKQQQLEVHAGEASDQEICGTGEEKEEGGGCESAKEEESTLEGPEELKEVMEYVVGVILDLDRRVREGGGTAEFKLKVEESDSAPSPAVSGEPEKSLLRDLRLNLLALAKRAPLDTIARLPPDLVPEQIRRFVPTLGG